MYDVLVVGSGVAGMSVLRHLPGGLRAALITLAAPGDAGSTPWAQGGVAVAWGEDDSPQLHAADTEVAGAGLCEPAAVEVLTSEGPARIAELLTLGTRFDRHDDGSLELTREAAHGRRRVVHAGDRSGWELAHALASALPEGVDVILGRVVRLLQHGSRMAGVELEGGRVLRAPHVVLATGGAAGLFAATTNPLANDGQGMALAFEAGAVLRDLEFVQFHPTALALPLGDSTTSLPLLTEALRGEGARLVDETGCAFMSDYDPAAELAPRDVVAFALWRHRQAGHTTFLDARMLPVAARFPQVYGLCAAAGFDPAQQLVPVTPAAHYHMGGIEVDLWGRTATPGLWACGECASTGVHGANRLASNSLLEGLVFGARVGQAIGDEPMSRVSLPPGSGTVATAAAADPLAERRVREILWTGMGLARSAPGLERARSALRKLLPRLNRAGEGAPAVGRIANLMLQSAQFRLESRGAHRRLDYPATRPEWAAHTRLVPGGTLHLSDKTPLRQSV